MLKYMNLTQYAPSFSELYENQYEAGVNPLTMLTYGYYSLSSSVCSRSTLSVDGRQLLYWGFFPLFW